MGAGEWPSCKLQDTMKLQNFHSFLNIAPGVQWFIAQSGNDHNTVKKKRSHQQLYRGDQIRQVYSHLN